MMNTFRTFKRALQLLVVFVAFWLEKIVEHDWLASQGIPPPIIWIFAAAVVIGLLWISEFLINAIFDRWGWFRRLLLRDDFIEGIWFNKVKLAGKELYGLLHIDIREESIAINGTQYDKHGNIVGNWISTMSQYANGKLTYAYSITYATRPDHQDGDGLSDITFTKHKGVPQDYVGRFQDICPNATLATTSTFVGRRIASKSDRVALDVSDKSNVIRSLISRFRDV